MDGQPLSRPKQEMGAVAPPLSLPMLSGGTAALERFLEGKKGLVVVFWSETCSHCLRYDAYFNGFSQQHPEIGFVVIAARKGETQAHIREAIASRKLHFPILHDADASVARQWYTQQTPRVFLLDAGLRLLYRGAIDNYRFPQDPDFEPYLEPALQQFLAGQPIQRPETASFGCAIESVYYVLPRPLS